MKSYKKYYIIIYMDYKQKYIKYKQKYLELKDSRLKDSELNDKQFGGRKKRNSKRNSKKQSRQQGIYNITIKQPWFDLIKYGKKTIEGRLNRGLFKKLQVGDKIEWIHKNLKFNVIVTRITPYTSFKQMMKTEGIDKVLPTINDIDSGVKLYRQYFTENDEKSNGVVDIEMKLDNKQIGGTIHEGKLQSPLKFL